MYAWLKPLEPRSRCWCGRGSHDDAPGGLWGRVRLDDGVGTVVGDGGGGVGPEDGVEHGGDVDDGGLEGPVFAVEDVVPFIAVGGVHAGPWDGGGDVDVWRRGGVALSAPQSCLVMETYVCLW